MTSKRWVWIGGGNHTFTTVHVTNLVAGIWCTVTRGKNNNVYYFTDGEDVNQREFLGRYVGVNGVDAGACWSIPSWLGWSLSYVGAVPPPFVHMFGQTFTGLFCLFLMLLFHFFLTQCTFYFLASDAKARRELGYKNVITIDEGFKELEAAAKGKEKE